MLIDIHTRAEADLSYIREAMARAEGFSAVSGWGIVGMGIVALLTGALASQATHITQQLIYWLFAAPMAATLGIAGSIWKSRQRGAQPLKDPAQRFLLCLLPPAGIAAVFTHTLWLLDLTDLLPSLWLMCYGCGVLAAGTYAARPVALMGGTFLACGLITMTLPVGWLNAVMTLSFGMAHLVFGWQVVKHHGG